MTIRIVVADQSAALFYETTRLDAPLRRVGGLTEPNARLHDRDLKSDRPGRVFDHAAASGQRRGSVAHHSTGGEHTPHKHEAEVFARHIAQQLETSLQQKHFDRIVLMAAPGFLGVLRGALSKAVHAAIVAEVPKDLVHSPESAVREHLPRLSGAIVE